MANRMRGEAFILPTGRPNWVVTTNLWWPLWMWTKFWKWTFWMVLIFKALWVTQRTMRSVTNNIFRLIGINTTALRFWMRTLPIPQKKNHRILKVLRVPTITRHQLSSLIRNYLMRFTTYRLWEVCNTTMPLTIIAAPKQWTWKRQSNRLTVKDKST